MVPSRMVALVDELEAAGLVQRERDPTDRRRNALLLTAEGTAALSTVASVGQAHDRDITQALSEPERRTLHEMLTRIAEQQQLTPGVHPGYRSLRPSVTPRRSARSNGQSAGDQKPQRSS
jgi:DNA-binding PadR family transcriptional regulator